MKKQSVKDRLHEGEGMVRHEMSEYSHSSRGVYRNEVDKPEMPSYGHPIPGMGMGDFYGQADSIAYGQAGMQGMKSDQSKMKSQFKDYHWE